LHPKPTEENNVRVRHEERDATKVNDSKADVAIRKDKARADKALDTETLKEDAQEVRAEIEQKQELKLVRNLKTGEQKVIAHERAHTSVGGGLTGSPSYSYTQGPDGKSYISGGEVPIDTSGGKTPEETIAKMIRARATALAPSNPSSQDRAVASRATVTETTARLEVSKEVAKAKEEVRAKEEVAEGSGGLVSALDEEAVFAPVGDTARSEAKVSNKSELKIVEKVDFKDKEADALKKISIYA
jgi:hypothetical protein